VRVARFRPVGIEAIADAHRSREAAEHPLAPVIGLVRHPGFRLALARIVTVSPMTVVSRLARSTPGQGASSVIPPSSRVRLMGG